MRRNATKLLAMFLAAILMVSLQTNCVFAENCGMEDSSSAVDMEMGLPYSVEPVKEEEMSVEKASVENYVAETEEFIAEEFQTADEDDEEETGTSSTIYYGTASGYLSATNDYLLYPANLTAGDYLQARLTLPNNSQIDYDLLLFNSSLSLIKSSDYVTYMNDEGTLDESIGYKATTDETVYVCVFSVAGGSETDAYTLDYSITTNFSGSNEPDENAKEATALTLEADGANVTGILNSPIDNDWYSFTVVDSPAYDKMRFNVSSSSTTNGCKFELYRNVVTSDYYGMQFLGYGTGGEVEMPAGTYYLRIVSTNTFSDFNASDIPTYNLSVVPVSRVDTIRITEIKASGGNTVTYPEGTLYRVDQSITQFVSVKGIAYYYDEYGVLQPAANACISGKIKDEQWEAINRPDMATVYSSAITNSNGGYSMYFNLNTALGGLSDYVTVSTHHYDLMEAKVYPADNENITATRKFFYLKYCD